jgi:mitochondrial fission protein ELM1
MLLKVYNYSKHPAINVPTLRHMKTLVITDDRIGSSNQSLALAKLLKLDHIVHEVHYSKLAMLPNLFGVGLKMLTKRSRYELEKVVKEQQPTMIITAGRRAAAIALQLKKRYLPKVKLVQILRPGLPFKKFDVVLLPSHDIGYFTKLHKNVIAFYGAIVYLDFDVIKEHTDIWRPKLLEDNQFEHVISVLIGGPTFNVPLSEGDIYKMLQKIFNIALEQKAAVLVTISRRTSVECRRAVYGIRRCYPDVYLKVFDYPLPPDENPYLALLGIATHIVVTADSISMCLEAVATGKLVSVFTGQQEISGKHRRFFMYMLVRKFINNLSVIVPPNKNTYPNLTAHYLKELQQRLFC